MPKTKLRFGELEAEESLPPMQTLAEESIETNGITGPTGEGELDADRRGVSMESDAEQYVVGDDFIYMRFAKEVGQEQKEFNEEGQVVIGESNIARIMRFLLTRDGHYAYESTQGVHAEDAVQYLIGDDPYAENPFEYEFTCNGYQRFSKEQMREFYSNSFRVRGLSVEGIGDREEEVAEVGDDVKALVTEAGEDAVRADFSTGSRDNDLSSSDIIDGFGRLSDVKYLRAKDREEEIREAMKSGRFVFSYPADAELGDQGQRARQVLEEVIDGLERVEE